MGSFATRREEIVKRCHSRVKIEASRLVKSSIPFFFSDVSGERMRKDVCGSEAFQSREKRF